MSETSGIDAVESANIGADETGALVGNAEEASSESSGGGHPAWKEILDTLPTSLHPIVTPALEKWDHGVQERFQQVQSKYDPYKQYVENNVNPQDIDKSLQIARMIETDPQGFYQRMGQYLNPKGQQDQGQQEDEDDYDISGEDAPDPRLQTMEQNQQVLAQALQAIMQKEADQKAEAQLDADLKSLREKHGDFDEEFVLSYAASNGGDLNAAVGKYIQIVAGAKGAPAPGSNLPPVVSPSGATPSSAVDPASLNSKDTKNLVVNLLQQMHGQS